MVAFVVDGDKGGVGKSFVARAVADYLITNGSESRVVVIDCDPSNADVVGYNGFHDEEVGTVEVIGLHLPVSSQEDWFSTVDRAVSLAGNKTDFVFSLPAGAGLYIDDTVLEMFSLIAPVRTIWVMGKDRSSTDQLDQRIRRAPMYYETGIVALNEYHGPLARGTFDTWKMSSTRRQIVADGAWKEITVPTLNAFITKQIGSLPLHRAVLRSSRSEISPTISVGIAAFRRVFHAQLGKAIGGIMEGRND